MSDDVAKSETPEPKPEPWTVPAVVRQHLLAFDNPEAMKKGESGGIIGDLRVTEAMFKELDPSNPAARQLMEWMTATIESFEALRKAVEDGPASSDNGN